jgi:energy-coupling factor transport system permease protein
MWAGTKIVVVGALGLALSIRPSWSAIGVAAVLLMAAGLVARVPLGAVPRPPRLFVGFVIVAAVLTLRAGGSPFVHVAGRRVGLGGIDSYARFFSLAVELLGASCLIGWTTSMAEVAPALARLGTPLRWMRLPVEEWAVTTALCIRCFPLLVGEFRTVRRLRPRPSIRPAGLMGVVEDILDVLAATLAASLRRAGELARAMEARGGPRLAPGPVHLGLRDGAAALLAALTCIGVFVLPA